MISRFLRKPQQAQPPTTPDYLPESDQDRREVAEIILHESRERRKGQEYRLEHYKKLATQVFGWDAGVL